MALDTILVDGHKQFVSHTYHNELTKYENLAKNGQPPHTLLITCSDSRIVPHDIFGAGPGDLFMVRNIAAQVSPFVAVSESTSSQAALEYGVTALKVRNIIVMGHTGCGGIAHVAAGNACPDFGTPSLVSTWMRPLDTWIKNHGDTLPSEPQARASALEITSIGVSVQNLGTFPFISEAIKRGDLNIHGTLYDIHTGLLHLVKETPSGDFILKDLSG